MLPHEEIAELSRTCVMLLLRTLRPLHDAGTPTMFTGVAEASFDTLAADHRYETNRDIERALWEYPPDWTTETPLPDTSMVAVLHTFVQSMAAWFAEAMHDQPLGGLRMIHTCLRRLLDDMEFLPAALFASPEGFHGMILAEAKKVVHTKEYHAKVRENEIIKTAPTQPSRSLKDIYKNKPLKD